ncbi:MAG: hypothetical protein J6Y26_04735 [Lachnospiraceae bacterium]|nr:hypothetical protein [Lachnospiraceae bacterium]
MSIREYAKVHHVEVVGRLIRHPDKEGRDQDGTPYRMYTDEIGNEYTINRNGICIVTADDCVI